MDFILVILAGGCVGLKEPEYAAVFILAAIWYKLEKFLKDK